jgi:predicted O-linked N-acetylglucosamine transferase (SPINDLY family)
MFLDTLPCNAHTTASDALFIGVPVITIPGPTFAGRVATSLLSAIGLPELIAPSLSAYETRALDLARSPGALGASKAKLKANRATLPLFDTARFTRNLEATFAAMRERQRRGLPPQSFSVARAP